MKSYVVMTVLCLTSNLLVLGQVDTSFIYNTSKPYGTLDIRLAKSPTQYYYLQEDITVSYRQSAQGVRTNTFHDMTTWNSSAYTQGNMREKIGSTDNFVMNYRLLFPVSYRPAYSPGYPIIIMMHGAGERGNCWDNKCYHADRNWSYKTNSPAAPTAANHPLMNNDHNLNNGGAAHLDARNLAGSKLPNDPTLPTRGFPGFILYPQNLNGWTAVTVQDAIRLLRLVIKQYKIDENRVYIHGLSNGGSAVYEAMKRAPWLFAAGLTMSAVSDANIVSQNMSADIAPIPLWIFQGGRDTAPSPGRTEGYIRAFRDAGAVVRYTKYDQLAHGTWNSAYKEPDFFLWILQQHRATIRPSGGVASICMTNGKGATLRLPEGFYRYQWERNGQLIAGANSAAYTAKTPGIYRARFSRVPNPAEADWNVWSPAVQVDQNNPSPPVVMPVGTLLLKDLNNNSNAQLNAVTEAAHYYWYKDGVAVDFPGSADDTVRQAILKPGTCSPTCTGNGTYTLVTAGYDQCPSPPSSPYVVYFNNQAPVNLSSPTNFAASQVTASKARLSWANVTTPAAGVELWRRKNISGSQYTPWQLVSRVAVPTSDYVDMTLEPSATYQYKIRAVQANGRSEYTPLASNQYLVVQTSADTVPPTTPTAVKAELTAINTVTLSWNASTDNTGIRQYVIYTNDDTRYTGKARTQYVWTGLTVNTTYSFQVRAIDLGGNGSAVSGPASVNTAVSGLYYEHSTGAWANLDEIDWSLVEFSGTADNFVLTPRTQDDYFNFRYDGYLYIANPGAYQFRTVSSDGSRVTLDTLVVVNNDGVHESKTATGPVVTLTAGPKRIVVKYFEYTGTQILNVRYKGPDTNQAWVDIPSRVLRSTPPPMAKMASTSRSDFSVSVFPNPSPAHQLQVRMSGTQPGITVSVRLLNLTGETMWQSVYPEADMRAGVTLNNMQVLPNGLYILVVEQGGRLIRQTVAIQN